MILPSITIRFYNKDWIKIRQLFPSEKNESAAHYFHRLRMFLEEHDFWVTKK